MTLKEEIKKDNRVLRYQINKICRYLGKDKLILRDNLCSIKHNILDIEIIMYANTIL